MNEKVNSKKLKQIERKRDYLARNSDYLGFIDTYKNDIKLINFNTGKYWNKKNITDRNSLLSSPIYKNKINIVVQLLKNCGKNILDIGVGNGTLEKKLNNLDYHLYGIDISNLSIKEIQKDVKGSFRVAKATKIFFDDNSINVVIALDILEHIAARKVFEVFSEISRLLVKKGVLILSIPLNEKLFGDLKPKNNPNGHLRMYTTEIIKMELYLAGYKIIEKKYLYAFKNNYFLKSLIARLHLFKHKPNILIIKAQKK